MEKLGYVATRPYKLFWVIMTHKVQPSAHYDLEGFLPSVLEPNPSHLNSTMSLESKINKISSQLIHNIYSMHETTFHAQVRLKPLNPCLRIQILEWHI